MPDVVIDIFMFIMGGTVAVAALGWLFQAMRILIKGK